MHFIHVVCINTRGKDKCIESHAQYSSGEHANGHMDRRISHMNVVSAWFVK